MNLQTVLIVTETFRPEINGVSRTLGYWVDGLKAKGINVHIVRPKQTHSDNPVNTASETHTLVTGFPIPGYSDLKFGLARSATLRKIIKQVRPCAVYIATEGPLGLSALRAASSLSLPVLTGFHTNFQSYSKHYGLGVIEPLILRYMRWFHNTSNGTLVPTKQLRDALELKGFKNLHVLSRGIDNALFNKNKRSSALRMSWGISGDQPVYLYVGRIAAEKNIALLEQTYNEIKKRHLHARLVMVGDGPLKPRLANKYPDIIFTGMLMGEELARHYASADIFLFPSQTDTFGNVVTEAMASGLCICSFDDAAAREHLQHNRSGFIAEPEDDDAFIAHALQAYEHDFLRHNVCIGSESIAAKLSWESIVAEFVKLLTLTNTENNRLGVSCGNTKTLKSI